MKMPPFGFRVVGHRAEKRRPIDWHAAFAGYASCDRKAELDREAFLSHFTFEQDFVDYLERQGSEKGYSGPCGASWLFWESIGPTTWHSPYAMPGGLPGRSWSVIANSMMATCSSS